MPMVVRAFICRSRVTAKADSQSPGSFVSPFAAAPARWDSAHCLAAHAAAWRNAKHAAQWRSTLKTYAEPVIGALAVQGIDTALVMKIVEPLWSKKPETASRLRGRIEAVLDWATVRGFRQGENPARWRGHLDKLLPAGARRWSRPGRLRGPFESSDFLDLTLGCFRRHRAGRCPTSFLSDLGSVSGSFSGYSDCGSVDQRLP
jgi:hypothetical protein